MTGSSKHPQYGKLTQPDLDKRLEVPRLRQKIELKECAGKSDSELATWLESRSMEKLKRLEKLQGDLEEGVDRADSALADIKKNKVLYPFGSANKRRLHVGHLRVIRDKTADRIRTARER